MPKLVNSSLKYRGKVGDEVFVDSRRYGHHVRKAQKAGARKSEWALKLQQGRNKNLNGLASSIRLVINHCYRELFRTNMYQRILQLIKREPSDSRSFSLLRLKGMEINLNYKLVGTYKVTVTTKKEKIFVNLEVVTHPIGMRVDANSYFNDLLLFTWNSTNGPAMVSRDFSEWTYIKDGLPEFEFVFPKPKGAIHWMVALREQMGVDCNDQHDDVYSVKAQGAQFLDVGSFNKKEQALLDQRWEEIREKKSNEGNIFHIEITHRVKAKTVKKQRGGK